MASSVVAQHHMEEIKALQQIGRLTVQKHETKAQSWLGTWKTIICWHTGENSLAWDCFFSSSEPYYGFAKLNSATVPETITLTGIRIR